MSMRTSRRLGREHVEPVRALRVEAELGLVAGDLPARGHEESVVEERVRPAHGEESGYKARQVGIEGRYVWTAPVLDARVTQVEVSERLHLRPPEQDRSVVRPARARCSCQVVYAIDEIGPEEAVYRTYVVTDPDERRRGETRSC